MNCSLCGDELALVTTKTICPNCEEEEKNREALVRDGWLFSAWIWGARPRSVTERFVEVTMPGKGLFSLVQDTTALPRLNRVGFYCKDGRVSLKWYIPFGSPVVIKEFELKKLTGITASIRPPAKGTLTKRQGLIVAACLPLVGFVLGLLFYQQEKHKEAFFIPLAGLSLIGLFVWVSEAISGKIQSGLALLTDVKFVTSDGEEILVTVKELQQTNQKLVPLGLVIPEPEEN